MKKILSLLCVGVMVLVGGVVMAGCGGEEYNFMDDEILVKLTQEAANSKLYTIEDFPEVGNAEVSIARTNSTLWYYIKLDTKSHENVLRIIEILKAREDVEIAQPVYLMSIGD